MIRIKLAGIFIAAGMALCSGLQAMPEHFALVPPEQAAALGRLRDTPEGKAIIGIADKAMLRNPNPKAVLHTQGTLPHQGIYDESVESARDLEAIRDLAMAWRLTRNNSYVDVCNRYYSEWLSTYRPSFNPIDETKFDNFIIAYDFVGQRVPSETRAKMEDFLGAMAEGYLESRNIRKNTEVNNWQSHRIKLITLAAFSLGDSRLVGMAERAFKRQLDANLQLDSSTIDYRQRDALHYVVYSLEPLTMAALAAKAHGRDWYHMKNRDGVSLEAALAWLGPYAEGQKTHEEFVRSTVRLDYSRKNAGVKGYSGPWEPKSSAILYNLGTLLDSRWEALARQLGKPVPWIFLILSLQTLGD